MKVKTRRRTRTRRVWRGGRREGILIIGVEGREVRLVVGRGGWDEDKDEDSYFWVFFSLLYLAAIFSFISELFTFLDPDPIRLCSSVSYPKYWRVKHNVANLSLSHCCESNNRLSHCRKVTYLLRARAHSRVAAKNFVFVISRHV